MAATKTWIITVSGDRPIHAVADELQNAGLDVDQVLAFTGTVVGHGSDDLADALRHVSGVADVSPDQPVEIGPPGAPIS